MPIGSLTLFLNAGVDLFFVISGFVMVISTDGRFSAGAFLWRRFIRIYPTWWFVCALFLALTAWQGSHAFPPSWDEAVGSMFLVPYEWDDKWRPALVVGWTLAYEVAFYLLFAACLGRSHAVIAGCLAASMFFPLFLEFAAGMLIARLVLGGWRPSAWLLPAGLVALLAVADMEAPRGLVRVLPAAMVIAGIIAIEGRVKSTVLDLLGSASYSIYLIHMLVLYVFWFSVGVDVPWPLMLAACIGCGVITHILVEAPSLRALRAVGMPLRERSSPCRTVSPSRS